MASLNFSIVTDSGDYIIKHSNFIFEESVPQKGKINSLRILHKLKNIYNQNVGPSTANLMLFMFSCYFYIKSQFITQNLSSNFSLTHPFKVTLDFQKL